MQNLQQWIKYGEGYNPYSYVDTNGHLTIGWGRNLERGISRDEAELMFQNDLNRTIGELNQHEWFINLPPGVKNALINMNFNLGMTDFSQFKDMIEALKEKDYLKASQAALNSKWAKEVHGRATDIALAIREGK